MININLSITKSFGSDAQFGISLEDNGVHLFGGDKPLSGFEDWGSVQLRVDGSKLVLSGRVSDFEAFAEQLMEAATYLQDARIARDSVPLPIEA